MGGGSPRACTAPVPSPPPSAAAPTNISPPFPPLPHLSSAIPTPQSVIPAPHRHSCAGRNSPTSAPPLSPIHSSPLSGGRLGGGWEPASMHSASPITVPSTAAPTNISPPFPTPPVIPAPAITCRFRQQLLADSRSSDLEILTQVEFELVDVNDRIVGLHEPREILVPAASFSDNDASH